MSTIILTGGGTAGHVMPALALLPELKKRFDTVHFIGGNGIEKELCAAESLPFHSVPVVKFDRTHPLNNVKIPLVLAKGVAEAKRLLSLLKPAAVFSKGGYASLPACFAAKSLDIPVIVHESDYSMGLANRLTSRFAARVITSFAETAGGKFIGNPVRSEILHGSRERALKNYPVDPAKKTLLIFGGSLGAEAINNVVYKGLEKITEKYNLIHISGKCGKFDKCCNGYTQLRFSPDMADLYALSDMVVARGGANTLSELACLGKRSIIIPLPKGNSRGDQLDNARSYERRGFVEILPQDELYVETLLAKIEETWNKMPPVLNVNEINSRIAEEIMQAVNECPKMS